MVKDLLLYAVFVVMLLGLTAAAFLWTRTTFAVVVGFAALVAVGALDRPTQEGPLGLSAFRAHPDIEGGTRNVACHLRSLQALSSDDPDAVTAVLRACGPRRESG